jgi:hypothetical protein
MHTQSANAATLAANLMVAAQAGDTDRVQAALAAGADHEAADEHGFTPLMKAVMAGHANVVAELLARGARNDGLRNVLSAFDVAIRDGRTECARLLLPHADPDREIAYYGSALHLAARARGWVEGVRMIANKRRAKKTDQEGNTPLMRSVGVAPEAFALLLPMSPLGVKNQRDESALSLLAFAALSMHDNDGPRARRWEDLLRKTWEMATTGQQNTALAALARQRRWSELNGVVPLASEQQLRAVQGLLANVPEAAKPPQSLPEHIARRILPLAEARELRESIRRPGAPGAAAGTTAADGQAAGASVTRPPEKRGGQRL